MGLIIGVTGGIATGKTTVTHYLQERFGCTVLDADVLAREAVAPGSEGLDAIARRYGLTMLQSDGTLDRSRLGRLVFEQPRERRWLEQLIHPWVRDRMGQGIEAWRDRCADNFSRTPLVLAIPLLFEANLEYLVDQIWVVSCDPEQQRQRLMDRDRLSRQEAQNRIAAQIPIQEKCDRADVVIANDGDRDELWKYLQELWLTTTSTARRAENGE